MDTPSSKQIQDVIAELLTQNTIMEESALNNAAQALLHSKIGAKIGSNAIATAIYRELGHMVDLKRVEKEPRDTYGQLKYRLNIYGHQHYFGTRTDRMKAFWDKHWLTIVLATINAAIGITALFVK